MECKRAPLRTHTAAAGGVSWQSLATLIRAGGIKHAVELSACVCESARVRFSSLLSSGRMKVYEWN